MPYSWNTGYHSMCLQLSSNSEGQILCEVWLWPPPLCHTFILLKWMCSLPCAPTHLYVTLIRLFSSPLACELLLLIFKFPESNKVPGISRFHPATIWEKNKECKLYESVFISLSAFSNTWSKWCSIIILEWRNFY